MEQYIHECHMYSMPQRDYYSHEQLNSSNSGKAEMCGDSKAVLSYILLSSNHPMAGYLLFLYCYQDQKILKL